MVGARSQMRKKVCGVVQYRIKEWRAQGAPYITTGAWFKMMIVLGQNNPDMAEIVEIAELFEGTTDDAHKYNLANLRKKLYLRVAQGYKSHVKGDIAKGNYKDLQCWESLVQEEANKATSSKSTC